MSNGKIGIGIVGCGFIASFHAEAIAQIPRAELVATMDVERRAAVALAERYGARSAYDKLDDLFEDPAVDLVDITTPSGLHAVQAIAAARAGRHVLVEKPMATSLAQADAMIAAAREARVKLGCIFQHRFSRAARFLKGQIDSGRFGRLAVGNAYVKWYRTQAYYDAGAWRGTWAMDGGGALSNQSIHTIDLLRWMMGPIDSIYGLTATRTHRIETEDVGVAAVRFASGALGTIVGSTSVYPGVADGPRQTYFNFPAQLEVFGESGSAILSTSDGRITLWKVADRPEEEAEVLAAFSEPEQPGYAGRHVEARHTLEHRRQIEDMVDAILAGREPEVNGEEARRSLEVLQGVYLSARTDRSVRLPISEPGAVAERG